jgi:SAM-dependent methyltransferase
VAPASAALKELLKEGEMSQIKSSSDAVFAKQFDLNHRDYLDHTDFFAWTRHFHVFKDLCSRVQGDVLEIGTGDGVLRRCAQPYVRSYRVADINPKLNPDFVADIAQHQSAWEGQFDGVIVTEVLEHLTFDKFEQCLRHLRSYLRPEGILFLSLPHRKGHMLVVTPRQRLVSLRFPVGLTSLSEAYNRFVRRKIWIDPHHRWEIGDGSIRRSHVVDALAQAGLSVERFTELPYSDYWLLKSR